MKGTSEGGRRALYSPVASDSSSSDNNNNNFASRGSRDIRRTYYSSPQQTTQNMPQHELFQSMHKLPSSEPAYLDIEKERKNSYHSRKVELASYQRKRVETTVSSLSRRDHVHATPYHQKEVIAPQGTYSQNSNYMRQELADAAPIMFGDPSDENSSILTGMSQQELLRKKARSESKRRKESETKRRKSKGSSKKKKKAPIVNMPLSLQSSPNRYKRALSASSSLLSEEKKPIDVEPKKTRPLGLPRPFSSPNRKTVSKPSSSFDDNADSTAETTKSGDTPRNQFSLTYSSVPAQHAVYNEADLSSWLDAPSPERDDKDEDETSAAGVSFPLLSTSASGKVEESGTSSERAVAVSMNSSRKETDDSVTSPERDAERYCASHQQPERRAVRFAEKIATHSEYVVLNAENSDYKDSSGSTSSSDIPWDEQVDKTIPNDGSPTSVLEAPTKKEYPKTGYPSQTQEKPKPILRSSKFSGPVRRYQIRRYTMGSPDRYGAGNQTAAPETHAPVMVSPPRSNSSFLDDDGSALSPIRPSQNSEESQTADEVERFGHPAEKHSRDLQTQQSDTQKETPVYPRSLVPDYPDPPLELNLDDESTLASSHNMAFIEMVAAIVIQTTWRRRKAKLVVSRMRRESPCPPEEEIQDRAYRMYFLAAVRIQSVFRGFWVRDCLDVDHYCATVIQKAFRRARCQFDYQFDLFRIVMVQSVWRRNIARVRAANLLACVIMIQALYRGHRDRENLKHHQIDLVYREQRHAAATAIQSRWRTSFCENNFIRSLVDILIVQSIARGWLARNAVHSMRGSEKKKTTPKQDVSYQKRVNGFRHLSELAQKTSKARNAILHSESARKTKKAESTVRRREREKGSGSKPWEPSKITKSATSAFAASNKSRLTTSRDGAKPVDKLVEKKSATRGGGGVVAAFCRKYDSKEGHGGQEHEQTEKTRAGTGHERNLAKEKILADSHSEQASVSQDVVGSSETPGFPANRLLKRKVQSRKEIIALLNRSYYALDFVQAELGEKMGLPADFENNELGAQDESAESAAELEEGSATTSGSVVLLPSEEDSGQSVEKKTTEMRSGVSALIWPYSPPEEGVEVTDRAVEDSQMSKSRSDAPPSDDRYSDDRAVCSEFIEEHRPVQKSRADAPVSDVAVRTQDDESPAQSIPYQMSRTQDLEAEKEATADSCNAVTTPKENSDKQTEEKAVPVTVERKVQTKKEIIALLNRSYYAQDYVRAQLQPSELERVTKIYGPSASEESLNRSSPHYAQDNLSSEQDLLAQNDPRTAPEKSPTSKTRIDAPPSDDMYSDVHAVLAENIDEQRTIPKCRIDAPTSDDTIRTQDDGSTAQSIPSRTQDLEGPEPLKAPVDKTDSSSDVLTSTKPAYGAESSDQSDSDEERKPAFRGSSVVAYPVNHAFSLERGGPLVKAKKEATAASNVLTTPKQDIDAQGQEKRVPVKLERKVQTKKEIIALLNRSYYGQDYVRAQGSHEADSVAQGDSPITVERLTQKESVALLNGSHYGQDYIHAELSYGQGADAKNDYRTAPEDRSEPSAKTNPPGNVAAAVVTQIPANNGKDPEGTVARSPSRISARGSYYPS